MIGAISPISGYGYQYYMPYRSLGIGAGVERDPLTGQIDREAEEDKIKGIDDSAEKSKGVGKKECQTCKNRKYVDGSDEMVSFKSPARISPGAAASRVRAHEQEHVSNAYKKAADGNGKVIQASVKIKTEICPECGRSYVAGGTTTTKIAYPKNDPYSQNQKSADRASLVGANLDLAV